MGALSGNMKALIDLQECDVRIKEIRRKIEEGPLKIQAIEAGLKEVEEEGAREAEQLVIMKRQRRGLEQEIEELEHKVEKSKIKLSNIKSNKEYQAALKEIDDLEAQKSLSEDKVLEVMEEMEILEERSAAMKEKRDALEKQSKLEGTEVKRKIGILQGELDELMLERDSYSRLIDQELLSRYNFLVEHKGGVAVSPVIKGVCQKCHMGIPPQKFNELKRGDVLMSCPNCSRIIYWGEDARFQCAPNGNVAGMSE